MVLQLSSHIEQALACTAWQRASSHYWQKRGYALLDNPKGIDFSGFEVESSLYFQALTVMSGFYCCKVWFMLASMTGTYRRVCHCSGKMSVQSKDTAEGALRP